MTSLRLPLTAILLLAAPAFADEERLTAAGRTVTSAQWKDIYTLYQSSHACLQHIEDPGEDQEIVEDNLRFKKICDTFRRLEKKLNRQGFCITSLHQPVGREGRNWTQKAWEQETGDKRTLVSHTTKSGRTIYCYPLHHPPHKP